MTVKTIVYDIFLYGSIRICCFPMHLFQRLFNLKLKCIQFELWSVNIYERGSVAVCFYNGITNYWPCLQMLFMSHVKFPLLQFSSFWGISQHGPEWDCHEPGPLPSFTLPGAQPHPSLHAGRCQCPHPTVCSLAVTAAIFPSQLFWIPQSSGYWVHMNSISPSTCASCWL